MCLLPTALCTRDSRTCATTADLLLFRFPVTSALSTRWPTLLLSFAGAGLIVWAAYSARMSESTGKFTYQASPHELMRHIDVACYHVTCAWEQAGGASSVNEMPILVQKWAQIVLSSSPPSRTCGFFGLGFPCFCLVLHQPMHERGSPRHVSVLRFPWGAPPAIVKFMYHLGQISMGCPPSYR
jgi:hypothetical protein